MKKILVPVSFSESSKNALLHAHSLAVQNGALLNLLHCYPAEKFNRKYDFGKEDYDKGIRRMLADFYKECIDDELHPKYGLFTFVGPISEAVSQISLQYDLFVVSRKTGFQSKKNKWFSDKLFYITSKALCPVLLLSSEHGEFSFQESNNIWHVKRKEIETNLIAGRLTRLGIDPNLVATKSMQQNTFISAFWRNIVSYSKNHDEGLLKDISKSFYSEKIDLLLLVNHQRRLFENFLKDDVFQIISQFDIPILIFQAKT